MAMPHVMRDRGSLFVRSARRRLSTTTDLRQTTDLRRPELLYPRARLWRRKVIFHGGPTNSGKTYRALEALKSAASGIYAGPLRLLAVEVFERLNLDGVYCSLFTGQERREVPFASHASCTIEMTPTKRAFEVAVVDEIQMLGSPDRGHAWTRALLGVDAREVHVCGSLDAADLVRQLCERTQDDFELFEYDRFTPLKVETRPVETWKQLQKGDCVVTFSKRDIHAVRAAISKETGRRCGVVYGALPPETRSHQAKLFNDDASKCDVLVASDAIGMGLNLNIRRVVFHSTRKYARNAVVSSNATSEKKDAVSEEEEEVQEDDQEEVDQEEDAAAAAFPEEEDDDASLVVVEKEEEEAETLKEATTTLTAFEKFVAPVEPALIKQIAGRAGRRSTLFDEGGMVAATTPDDLTYVRDVMANATVPLVPRAGVFPLPEMLAAFAKDNGLEDEPLTEVVAAFGKVCAVDESLFFFCGHEELSLVSGKLYEVLAPTVERFPVDDALIFCSAPCNVNDRFALNMLAAYATAHYEAVVLGKPRRVAPNVRVPKHPPNVLTDLHDLCSKHNVLDMYIWLHFRYSQTFPEIALARAQKSHCIDLIAKALQADVTTVVVERKRTTRDERDDVDKEQQQGDKQHHQQRQVSYQRFHYAKRRRTIPPSASSSSLSKSKSKSSAPPASIKMQALKRKIAATKKKRSDDATKADPSQQRVSSATRKKKKPLVPPRAEPSPEKAPRLELA